MRSIFGLIRESDTVYFKVNNLSRNYNLKSKIGCQTPRRYAPYFLLILAEMLYKVLEKVFCATHNWLRLAQRGPWKSQALTGVNGPNDVHIN
jgi:hypothetical protein